VQDQSSQTEKPLKNPNELMAKEYASKIDYMNPVVRNFAVMQVQTIYEYVKK